MQPSLLSKHIVNISNSGSLRHIFRLIIVDDTFRNIIIRNSGNLLLQERRLKHHSHKRLGLGILCNRLERSNRTVIRRVGERHLIFALDRISSRSVIATATGGFVFVVATTSEQGRKCCQSSKHKCFDFHTH